MRCGSASTSSIIAEPSSTPAPPTTALSSASSGAAGSMSPTCEKPSDSFAGIQGCGHPQHFDVSDGKPTQPSIFREKTAGSVSSTTAALSAPGATSSSASVTVAAAFDLGRHKYLQPHTSAVPIRASVVSLGDDYVFSPTEESSPIRPGIIQADSDEVMLSADNPTSDTVRLPESLEVEMTASAGSVLSPPRTTSRARVKKAIKASWWHMGVVAACCAFIGLATPVLLGSHYASSTRPGGDVHHTSTIIGGDVPPVPSVADDASGVQGEYAAMRLNSFFDEQRRVVQTEIPRFEETVDHPSIINPSDADFYFGNINDVDINPDLTG